MIKLALEIPTAKLGEWSPAADLDFALAHRVLEDDSYAKFYRMRPGGRELILDNSFHELGEPLAIDELVRAAKKVHADYVVAPDRLEDPEWTLVQFKKLSREPVRTAVVLGGETPEYRSHFIEQSLNASMLCLPYRRPRLEWFVEQRPPWKRVHLLGMSSFPELRGWKWIAQQLPHISFSVDTSKPIKWGLLGRRLSDDNTPIRHAPISSKDLLELSSITPEQSALVYQNIVSLRSFLRST